MYFHGLDEFGLQNTRALPFNGLNFYPKEKIVGWPYLRKFSYKDNDFALSMPGIIYKKVGDIDEYEIQHQVMEETTRHSAVMVEGDTY